MTNLTEKLRKGELPDNHHYYYKLPNGTIEVGNTFCLELLHNCKDGDKIQILCEVPTYDDYERLNWYAGNGVEENTKLKTENKWYSEQLNEAVKKEAQLKELLTMVKPVLQLEYNKFENRNLIERIDEAIK
jgi:hypothetical protein